MEHSENIGNLAAALAAAQAELLDPAADQSATIPGKDGKAGFSYKYADLAGYLPKARPVLGKHGLAITQGVSSWENGITVTTMLLHGDSDEWLRESLSMLAGGNPQSVGGVITHARRYSLAPLLGLATEDDLLGMQSTGSRATLTVGGAWGERELVQIGLSGPEPADTAKRLGEQLDGKINKESQDE